MDLDDLHIKPPHIVTQLVLGNVKSTKQATKPHFTLYKYNIFTRCGEETFFDENKMT